MLNDIREQFPILQEKVHGHPLVYFDNAATTQKPRCVIDAITHYYTHLNANVHRGVHYLSEKATAAYEATRDTLRDFIHAAHREEIIFTKGTTESINLIAQSFVRPLLYPGDEIIVSAMEHHSNIVPWQMVCEQTGAVLKIIPMNQAGELLLEAIPFSTKTKFLTVTHIANALGTINPIQEIIQAAHARHIPVLIDGAQAIHHLPVNVQSLDCDFYVFSSHKMYGPTGVGILYGKKALLESMPPYQGGGEMIKSVTFEKTIYQDIPHRFEAGTPNIADVVALRYAVQFILDIGFETLHAHEQALLLYATDKLKNIPHMRFIGEAKHKTSLLAFVMNNAHAHDVGTILDQQGIAVRTGHHCAMPVMEFYGVAATVRVSFAIYNTLSEIDQLVLALQEVNRIFH